VVVSPTATKVAGHAFAYFFAGWAWVIFKKGDTGHHLAWCAETTLGSKFVNHRLLDWMQCTVWLL
jgi:hypothetical protein